MTHTESTGAALRAAICADPRSDDLRLVYADWLDDNGQPERGEFIRVQVEIASLGKKIASLGKKIASLGKKIASLGKKIASLNLLSSYDYGLAALRDDEREIHLRRRQNELFRNSGPAWWNPLPGAYRATESSDVSITTAEGWKYVVRRGFVADVQISFAGWVGVECPHCAGDAWRYGRDGMCNGCHGLGRVNAHGHTIVACQPVEKVTTEKRPYLLLNGPEVWGFACDDSDDPGSLPRCVFNLLPASEDGNEWATTGSEWVALDFLSTALIRWSRDTPA